MAETPPSLDLSVLPNQTTAEKPPTLDLSVLPNQPAEPKPPTLDLQVLPNLPDQLRQKGSAENWGLPQATIGLPGSDKDLEYFKNLRDHATSDEELLAGVAGQPVLDALKRIYSPDTTSPKALAAAQNAIAISQQIPGMSPAYVLQNQDAINQALFGTGEAREKFFMNTIGIIPMLMGGGGTAAPGMVYNTVKEGQAIMAAWKALPLGLAGIEAWDNGTALIDAYKNNLSYRGAGLTGLALSPFLPTPQGAVAQPYGLSRMLPEDASEGVKTVVGLLDMFAKYKAMQVGGNAALSGLGNLWDAAAYQKVSEIVPGQKLYIPAEEFLKARGAVGTETNAAGESTGSSGRASPYYEMVQNLHLDNATIMQAAKHGLDVEIPLSGVVRSMDRPWWGWMKGVLKMSPYLDETEFPGSPATSRLHVSGELEAPAQGGAAPGETAPPGGGPAPAQPAGPVPQQIIAEAQRQGVNPDTALAIWRAEGSVTDPNVKNPKSSATGIFQHLDSTWAGQGGTPDDRFDANKQIELGVALAKQNTDALTKELGRQPQSWEVYLAHQQGIGGATALLHADPNANAGEVVGNPKAITLNGGTSGMTAGQFLDHIRGYVDKHSVVGETTPGITRQTFVDAIDKNPTIPQEQKDTFMALADARARAWAETEGKTPDDWYSTYIASVKGGAEEPLPALFQEPEKLTAKNIPDLYDYAISTPTNQKVEIKYATVDSDEAARLKEVTGIDLSGYTHSIDNFAIRHINNKHGDSATEDPRGQVAITRDDIQRIPEITANPDKITSFKTNQGRDGIAYTKKVNGNTFYVEEIRTGKKQLAAVSMRKYKTGASNLPESLPAKTHTSETLPGQDIDNIASQIESGKPEVLEQQKKGAAQFLEDGKAILHLFETADVSTLVHEFGHILRRQLSPEDMASAEKWTKVEGGNWTRPKEEKFARAFESYIMEGVAPSHNLRSVFAKLKDWMMEIYKSIRNLKVRINDDIRGLFDRLLSTEAERKANTLYQMNDEYDNLEVPETPVKAVDMKWYDQVQAEAVRRAGKAVDAMEEKAVQKFAQDLRRQARQQYDVEVVPNMVREIASKGINRDSLRTWDKDTVRELVRRWPGLVKKNGFWGVDEAAQMHGYDSDDDLVQTLLNFPTKDAYVENFVSQGMQAHSDELGLTATERQMALVDQEIKIFNEILSASVPEWKNTTTPGIRSDINRRIVEQDRGNETVGTISSRTDYDNLKAGIRMAARNAKIAFSEGKQQEALAQKEKQKQLLEDLQSRYQARDEVKKLTAKINRIANAGTTSAGIVEEGETKRIQAQIPVEYRKQIAQILQAVGWRGFDKVRIEEPEPLMDFLQRKFDEGEIYESNFAALEFMHGKGQAKLTLDALHDLHDCLNEIFHKARTSGILQTTADRIAVLDATRAMAARIMEYHNPILLPAGSENALAPYDERDGLMKRALSKLRGWNTANLEVETLLEWADGWTRELGPNWTYGYKPINDGSTKVYELEKRSAEFGKILERFGTSVKGIGPWAQEKFAFPELGGKFLRKSQMMAFALHYGNEGNRNALKNSFKIPDSGGAPQSLTDAQVWAVISKLTPEEWQAVIDTARLWNNDETRAQLAETYLANTGNEFPFLPLGKVTVPHLGEVDEWHAPLMDDKDASYQMEKRGAMDESRDLFSRNYRPQSPKNGFTKQRLAGARHILDLDFVSVVSKFLADQNRYIGLTVPLRDTQKVFNAPAFRMAMENYIGKDYHRMLLPWLQDKARPQSELLSAPVAALGKLRRNGVMVHIGVKFWTVLKHTPQLLMLAESVSGPRVMQAIFNPHNGTIIRPFTARAFIEQDNPFMQSFFDKSDRDISEFYTNFDPNRWKIKHTFDKVMLSGIELMVNFLARTGWMAEYNSRLNDPSNLYDIASAREYANKVVRDNLGSYDPKDLSKMRRGSELDKLLTAFMTVPAALYQRFFRMATMAFGPNQGNTWERTFRFVRSAMYIIMALAVADAFFEKRRLPSLVEIGKQVPMVVTNTVPFLRDVVGSLIDGHDYSLSFVGDALKSLVDAARHIPGMGTGREKWDKYAFERSMTALGFFTGLPTDQMAITAEGIANLGQPGYEPWNVLIKPPAPEQHGPRRRGRR